MPPLAGERWCRKAPKGEQPPLADEGYRTYNTRRREGSEGSGRKVLRIERPYGPRVVDCRFAAFITPAEPARSVGEALNPGAAGASPLAFGNTVF